MLRKYLLAGAAALGLLYPLALGTANAHEPDRHDARDDKHDRKDDRDDDRRADRRGDWKDDHWDGEKPDRRDDRGVHERDDRDDHDRVGHERHDRDDHDRGHEQAYHVFYREHCHRDWRCGGEYCRRCEAERVATHFRHEGFEVDIR